jgi:transposase
LIEHRSPHILHLQKALLQMNLQLPTVISDVMGETGQAIIRALVAGERDPLKLARLRFPGCQSSEDDIAKALTGTWQSEHLFELKQNLQLVDYYTQILRECDAELEQRFAAIKPRWDAPAKLPKLPKAKPGSRSKNAPTYHARAELYRITGVDLVAITGISASLAQTIISEVGTDMSRFPTEKHFCSWLGLVPHHEISGGKILRNHTLKTDNRAGQAFRQAAACVIRSQSAFGAFYRRKRAQLGPMQAQVATAHKIARTVYHLLKYKTAYHDVGAKAYEQQAKDRQLAHLRKTAAKLGYALTATTT